VERLPEGSFVFYRATRTGATGALLTSLFQQIDPATASLVRDRAKLAEVSASRAASAESFFSQVAPDWDRVRGLHYPNEAIESALLKLAGPERRARVVDFGTGTGRMLALFAPLADEAEGVDLSHGMLTVARVNLQSAGVANASVRQGDVTTTPFAAGSVDLVIIHQVLHFMIAPGRAIEEAARILKPGGHLLVVDFAPHDLEFLRTEHGHHRLGLRHDTLAQWAKDAGLVLEAPLEFAPPKSAKEGLTVNVWRATRSSLKTEKAA
jgi:ArsR family transcriptional regulator